jgi:DNA-binding transcriptional regulator YdaS (Cro superfamily)
MLEMTASKTDADAGVKAVLKALKLRKERRLPISSANQLSKHLQISRQSLAGWKKVPPEHVLKIEELIDVSRHVQRSDIFGPQKARALKVGHARKLRR